MKPTEDDDDCLVYDSWEAFPLDLDLSEENREASPSTESTSGEEPLPKFCEASALQEGMIVHVELLAQQRSKYHHLCLCPRHTTTRRTVWQIVTLFRDCHGKDSVGKAFCCASPGPTQIYTEKKTGKKRDYSCGCGDEYRWVLQKGIVIAEVQNLFSFEVQKPTELTVPESALKRGKVDRTSLDLVREVAKRDTMLSAKKPEDILASQILWDRLCQVFKECIGPRPKYGLVDSGANSQAATFIARFDLPVFVSPHLSTLSADLVQDTVLVLCWNKREKAKPRWTDKEVPQDTIVAVCIVAKLPENGFYIFRSRAVDSVEELGLMVRGQVSIEVTDARESAPVYAKWFDGSYRLFAAQTECVAQQVSCFVGLVKSVAKDGKLSRLQVQTKAYPMFIA